MEVGVANDRIIVNPTKLTVELEKESILLIYSKAKTPEAFYFQSKEDGCIHLLDHYHRCVRTCKNVTDSALILVILFSFN